MMRAEDIEAEYRRRLAAAPQAQWGWSFMYTKEAALQSARVVLVGLNPGGKEPTSCWEHSGVNAYIDQPWGENDQLNGLQCQVDLMFKALHVRPDEVFAANFTPFRSPSWKALPDQQGALSFGRSLWNGLLPRTTARLFLSLGKQSARELAALMEATFVQSHGVEWGSQTIDEYVARDGRTVLAVPHLSRFRIFGGSRLAAADLIGANARRLLG